MEHPAQFVLLVAVAVVIARPRELPGIGRAAGRAVGAGVRLLRESREAALRAASDSAAAADVPESVAHARRMVARSVRSFDSISEKLRQEIVPLTFIPRKFMDLAGTAADAEAQGSPPQEKTASVVSIRSHAPAESGPGVGEAQAGSQAMQGLKSIDNDKVHHTGADVISAVIEESALARQQTRVLGSNTWTHKTSSPESSHLKGPRTAS